MILRQLANETTLLNLITAYPIYNPTALQNREEILTSITLNHVLRNGYDPFGAHDVFALRFHDGIKVGEEFWDTILNFHNICQQYGSLRGTAPLKISVAICRQILQIADAVGWTVVEKVENLPVEGDGKPDWSRITSFRYSTYVEEVGRRGECLTGYLHGGTVNGNGAENCYPAFFFAPRVKCYSEHMKDRIMSTITNMEWCTYPSFDWDDEF